MLCSAHTDLNLRCKNKQSNFPFKTKIFYRPRAKCVGRIMVMFLRASVCPVCPQRVPQSLVQGPFSSLLSQVLSRGGVSLIPVTGPILSPVPGPAAAGGGVPSQARTGITATHTAQSRIEEQVMQRRGRYVLQKGFLVYFSNYMMFMVFFEFTVVSRVTLKVVEFSLNNTNLTFLAFLYKNDIEGILNQKK